MKGEEERREEGRREGALERAGLMSGDADRRGQTFRLLHLQRENEGLKERGEGKKKEKEGESFSLSLSPDRPAGRSSSS